MTRNIADVLRDVDTLFRTVLPKFNLSSADADAAGLSRDEADLLNAVPNAVQCALRDHDRAALSLPSAADEPVAEVACNVFAEPFVKFADGSKLADHIGDKFYPRPASARPSAGAGEVVWPVAADVLAALRRFVADAEPVDLGGGDAVVTTCESLEMARAALSSVAPAAEGVDLEAIAWAYRKLLDFGCYTSEAGAMMGDRLNMMLLTAPGAA